MTRKIPALLSLLLTLGVADASFAARVPVLRQVDLPHSYYWREMFLPQLTSGPSSVAFSPDGRRLLVPWPEADQWLFLSTAPGGRIAAVANIGRQFAAGPRGGPFPDAVQWCCAG